MHIIRITIPEQGNLYKQNGSISRAAIPLLVSLQLRLPVFVKIAFRYQAASMFGLP